MRVRCLINLDIPLESGFWVSLKYERPQNFCYHCSHIGHDEKTCKNKIHVEHVDKNDGEFRHWMRTPHVKTLDEHVIVMPIISLDLQAQ